MNIGGRRIAPDAALFVIAEIGLNHGGSTEKALRLVDAAVQGGASAVKLQTLSASSLVARECPAPAHARAASLQEFFRTFELNEPSHRRIADAARRAGLVFLSTPFDERAVDMLERVGCDGYKIASGDLTHLALIERTAATGKPLVISTGMSRLSQVGDALACARRAGARDVALMHSVSAYPVPNGEQNLRAIATLAASFGVPVGLSDHGMDPLAAPLAVAMGATLYEKHIVLEGDDDAIDAAVSASPGEFAAIVSCARAARLALGDGVKACRGAEAVNEVSGRRGLYATRDLPAGHTLTSADVIALRPAAGVSASRWRDVLGAQLRTPVASGSPLRAAALDGWGSRDAA